MRILIVEDDLQFSNMLKSSLIQEGYAVDVVHTGEEGEALAVTIPYDLILLGIMLPGKDGIEVCKSLRDQKVNIPIMMVTVKKDDSDIMLGIDSGADDYIVKPFHIGVLYSRIRALTRRSPNAPNSKILINNLILDTVTQQVWRGSDEIQITSKEYAILEYLASHPNTIINRSTLEQHVWNLNMDSSSNVIDTHIKNLRAKLGKENRDLIQTVRGRGFRLGAD